MEPQVPAPVPERGAVPAQRAAGAGAILSAETAVKERRTATETDPAAGAAADGTAAGPEGYRQTRSAVRTAADMEPRAETAVLLKMETATHSDTADPAAIRSRIQTWTHAALM